ncbi:MAG: MFS transporter [Candidatus Sericytochromatia bacterium]|nr:MFS transporter [Candidatus Sericytochromatia bacterium]
MNPARANLWKLRLYWFGHSLVFAYVIERVFGLSRGLSVQDMVTVEIFYALAALVLEVPTGALADRWSRKKTLLLSSFCIFFEFFLLIFAFNLWGFLASALAAALGGALASGTANALLYDSLLETGEQSDFERQLGRIGLWESLAGLIGALGGAWVAVRWGLTSPYWLSLLGVVLAFGTALSLHEPAKQGEPVMAENLWAHMGEALTFLRGQPVLQKIVLLATCLAAVFQYVDEYLQIYMQGVGVPVAYFGLFYACYMGGEAGFRSLAYRFKEIKQPRWLFAGLLGGFALFLLWAAALRSLWGLLPLFLALACVWLSQPLTTGYLHHRTPSSHRATVESFAHLLTSLLAVAVGLAFGQITTRWDIFSGYRFLTVVLLGFLIYWALAARNLPAYAAIEAND